VTVPPASALGRRNISQSGRAKNSAQSDALTRPALGDPSIRRDRPAAALHGLELSTLLTWERVEGTSRRRMRWPLGVHLRGPSGSAFSGTE